MADSLTPEERSAPDEIAVPEAPAPTKEPTTAQEFADRIRRCLDKTVGDIVEIGEWLNRAQDALDHGEWGRMFHKHPDPVADPLRISQDQAQDYMAVAGDGVLSNSANWPNLPPALGTLRELVRLHKKDPDLFAEALADGRIHHGMKLKDVYELIRGAPKPLPPPDIIDKVCRTIDEAMFAYRLRGEWQRRAELRDRLAMMLAQFVPMDGVEVPALFRAALDWATAGGPTRRWLPRYPLASEARAPWHPLPDKAFLRLRRLYPTSPDALRFYFAGSFAEPWEDVLIDLQVPYRLVSFGYMEKEIDQLVKYWDERAEYWKETEHAIQRPALFLDSGAYTVWKKGRKVDLDEYADFILEWPRRFSLVANLDVIPGKFGQAPPDDAEIERCANEGWENWKALTARLKDAVAADGTRGITPMHIYHQGEDIKWLKKLMDEAEYFGVSPTEHLKEAYQVAWLEAEVMPLLTDDYGRPIRKFHGFGVGSRNLLFRYPWYSADASTWVVATTTKGRTVPYPGAGMIAKHELEPFKPASPFEVKIATLHILDVVRNCRPFALGGIRPDATPSEADGY